MFTLPKRPVPKSGSSLIVYFPFRPLSQNDQFPNGPFLKTTTPKTSTIWCVSGHSSNLTHSPTIPKQKIWPNENMRTKIIPNIALVLKKRDKIRLHSEILSKCFRQNEGHPNICLVTGLESGTRILTLVSYNCILCPNAGLSPWWNFIRIDRFW